MTELIRVVAVGDLMLGDHPVRIGNGVRSTIEKMGDKFLFSKIHKLLNGYDIVFGNLEVVHSDIGLIQDRIDSVEFRGTPDSLPILKDAGFNVLGVANNHCMEHGLNCFNENLDLLNKNGIFASGYKKLNNLCNPYIKCHNGVKVLLLSYSLRPENYCKKGDVPYSFISDQDLVQEVVKFKNKADVFILSLHWGEEFIDYPSPRQVNLAHNLIDNGVNLILGHHPHVLQGIEKYNHGIIAYSLGNFVFDMWQRKTRESLLFRAILSKHGVVNFDIIPILINKFYQPVPLENTDRHEAIRKINILKDNIITKYNNIKLWPASKIEKHELEYQEKASRETLLHRIGNYLFFIVNFYKYKPVIIYKSLLRSFSRRLNEISELNNGKDKKIL